MKNEKENGTLLISAMISYLYTKSLGFERGSLTYASQKFGKRYNVKITTLGPMISYVKCLNNHNNKSFILGKRNKEIIDILNTMNVDELVRLNEILQGSSDNFDFLKYLKENL